MTTLVASAALFVTDCFIAYAGGRWLEAWGKHKFWRAVGWDIAISLVIGINLASFIELGWQIAIPVSTVASALGVALSFIGRRKPSDRA